MIIGDQNSSTTKMISRTGVTNDYTYATSGAISGTAAATNPFVIDGSVAEDYIGIVIGYHGNEVSNPPYEVPIGENPPISGDETTFTINHTDITVTANTVSTVTNPFTGVSQFTVERSFTNDATTNKYVNRVGILTKGTADGSTLGTDQCFMTVNKPSGQDPITIEPGQTLKVTYTFQIKV